MTQLHVWMGALAQILWMDTPVHASLCIQGLIVMWKSMPALITHVSMGLSVMILIPITHVDVPLDIPDKTVKLVSFIDRYRYIQDWTAQGVCYVQHFLGSTCPVIIWKSVPLLIMTHISSNEAVCTNFDSYCT